MRETVLKSEHPVSWLCPARKVWDFNKEAPAEVGRDHHLMLASNVLHTATDLSGEDTVTGVLWCPASAHLQRL